MAQSMTLIAESETLSRLGINISCLIFCACTSQDENTVFIIDYKINITLRYLVNELTF